jgi:AcrR family transcriptional regulator
MTKRADESTGGAGSGSESSPSQPRRRGRPRLDAQMVPQILDAAERLFASRGVSVSIRDIGDEAGLPHSAIYRYFRSKDDVLRQVLLRGRRRQIEHEAQQRAEGRTTQGALDWLMKHNRAYAMTVVRAALEGETTSSLGVELSGGTPRLSLEVVRDGLLPVEVRTDHDPRMVMAALMALSLGWVTAEDWIVEAVGMPECDRHKVRAAIDDIMASMVAMAKGPEVSCE